MVFLQDHWPSLVHREAIDSHIQSNNLKKIENYCQTMIDTECFIWRMKEPHKTIKNMVTGSSLLTLQRSFEEVDQWKCISLNKIHVFPLAFSLWQCHHYNNNLCHSITSSKDTWRTGCWPEQMIAICCISHVWMLIWWYNSLCVMIHQLQPTLTCIWNLPES